MRHRTRRPSLHSTCISSDMMCSIFLYQTRVGLTQIRVLLVLVSSLIPCQFVCDITDAFGVAHCTCDLTQVVRQDSHIVVEQVSSTDCEQALMIAVLQHRGDQRTVEVLVEPACLWSRTRSSRWCWWSCKTKRWKKSSERTKRLDHGNVRESGQVHSSGSGAVNVRDWDQCLPCLYDWQSYCDRRQQSEWHEDRRLVRINRRLRTDESKIDNALATKGTGVFREVSEVFIADFDFWHRFTKSSQHFCLRSWRSARRSDGAGRERWRSVAYAQRRQRLQHLGPWATSPCKALFPRVHGDNTAGKEMSRRTAATHGQRSTRTFRRFSVAGRQTRPDIHTPLTTCSPTRWNLAQVVLLPQDRGDNTETQRDNFPARGWWPCHSFIELRECLVVRIGQRWTNISNAQSGRWCFFFFW